MRVTAPLMVIALVVAAAPLAAQAPAPAKNDYSKPDTWLCRPGVSDDACAVDLTTTVVDGGRTVDARDVYRESQGANRLLLRVSHHLDGPGRRTAT